MVAGKCIDQLGRYAYRVSSLSNAAFQNITNAQLFGDMANPHWFSLIGKYRIAGDNENFRHIGKCADYFLG
jgi:hypothetical protein